MKAVAISEEKCACAEEDRKVVIFPSRLWGCASCGLGINYSIGISDGDALDDRTEGTRPATSSADERNQENRRKKS